MISHLPPVSCILFHRITVDGQRPTDNIGQVVVLNPPQSPFSKGGRFVFSLLQRGDRGDPLSPFVQLVPYEWICAQNNYNFIKKEHCWSKYLKIQGGKVEG